ncbi:hypothetical protein MMC11_004142 [Xylographa trunciseda]|nr:hypothetical protein [Xylographa trunciseda]
MNSQVPTNGDSAKPRIPEKMMDHETRLRITMDMIQHMPEIVTPPKDFEPLKVSNTELVKNGFPPRPDKQMYPKLRALWEDGMARQFTIIKPDLQVDTTTVHYPKPKVDETVVFDNVWSGAVFPNPPAGNTFYTITGAWIIPNPYPPPTTLLSNGKFADGTYQAAAWIGLDGYGTEGVLQCGTTSVCVVSGGNITSQTAYAWYEWFPAYPVKVGLAVKPGDLMQAIVCGLQPTQGSVILTNMSSNVSTPSYTIAEPTLPYSKTLVPLLGQTAEWIMEDASNASGNPVVYTPVPFSNYGATFFYNCLQASRNAAGVGTEGNLAGASLLNIVHSPTTLSTAIQESNTVLQTYAYANTPSTIP